MGSQGQRATSVTALPQIHPEGKKPVRTERDMIYSFLWPETPSIMKFENCAGGGAANLLFDYTLTVSLLMGVSVFLQMSFAEIKSLL